MSRKYDENTHHSYSQSLFPLYRSASWNRREVNRHRHDHWHALVVNRSPCDAVLKLLQEFGPRDSEKLALDPSLDDLIDFLLAVKRARK